MVELVGIGIRHRGGATVSTREIARPGDLSVDPPRALVVNVSRIRHISRRGQPPCRTFSTAITTGIARQARSRRGVGRATGRNSTPEGKAVYGSHFSVLRSRFVFMFGSEFGVRGSGFGVR